MKFNLQEAAIQMVPEDPQNEVRVPWKIKFSIFAAYFSFVIIPLMMMSINFLYPSAMTKYLAFPNIESRNSSSLFVLLLVIISLYIVSIQIFNFSIDDAFDTFALSLGVYIALFWVFEFHYQGTFYSFLVGNPPLNYQVMILCSLFIIISLFLVNRPRFRFGIFIQTTSISLLANLLMASLKGTVETGVYITIMVVVVIVLVFGVFGYSLYRRYKIDATLFLGSKLQHE